MRLHLENDSVKQLLFQGNFGLEKEALRITEDGHMAHTPHPFPGDERITRDFCENQTEINTTIFKSVEEVVANLDSLNRRRWKRLNEQEPRELLWTFSNPPYIRDEEDIPIAVFENVEASKMQYRQYLANVYGRYKMTFSGIHFNFSFGGDLLRAEYAAATGETIRKGEETKAYREYCNKLYLTLAERLVDYGWLVVAVTAASPLLDGSFFSKEKRGEDVVTGMASVRCSEMGYWNAFTPVFDYEDIIQYTDSIEKYVSDGWISAPSELYYPIRLKPKGANRLDTLRERGVNHIELRMIDLNPLRSECIDSRDLKFAHLLILWLMGLEHRSMSSSLQVQAMSYYKSAAHYDLDSVKIISHENKTYTIRQYAIVVLEQMERFYADNADALEVLAFEKGKFIDPDTNSYAHIILHGFSEGFVEKGIALSKQRQHV